MTMPTLMDHMQQPGALAGSQMVCLIAISHATRSFGPWDISEILRSSLERHRRLGITGVLLYHEGMFMHVFEGERSAVMETIALIRKDWRVHRFHTLLEEVIGGRHFADWAMALDSGDDLPPDERCHVRSLAEAVPERLGSDQLRWHLTRLAGRFREVVALPG